LFYISREPAFYQQPVHLKEVHMVRFSAACCTWVFTEFRQTKLTTVV